MKKVFTLLTLTLTGFLSFGQMTGQLFRGTLKPGSAANSVMAVIRSSSAFNGQVTNVQFTFQIPNTVSPRPTVSIKSNPLSTYIPTANYLTQVVNENGFFTYLFAATTTGSPVYNFSANAEINALEVEITGATVNMSTVRLSHLPSGGSTYQLAFFVEVGGNDNTNYTSMFYGNGGINGGSYEAYSFIPLQSAALPLTWLNFSAQKQNGSAFVKWDVANQVNNDYFEVQVSNNGSTFSTIGKVTATGKTSYSFTDPNINKLQGSYAHYRIRQVDKDGKASYSEIRKLLISGKDFAFTVVGNPIKGNTLNIGVQSPENSEGVVTVVDLNGRQVFMKNITWSSGYSQQALNIPFLPAGSYTANLVTASEKYQVRFMK